MDTAAQVLRKPGKRQCQLKSLIQQDARVSEQAKTRSGKIMRRILRKIAQNDYDNLGDTSTLAEPKVVKDLIKNRVV